MIGREDGGGSPTAISGVKSRVYIASGAQCWRIASVSSINAGNGATLEFGYVRGWINCTGTGNTWTRYTKPTPFAYWEYAGGKWDCATFPGLEPPSGGTATFQVSDANHNGFWGSWYNGKDVQPNGIKLGTTAGYALVNMERGAKGDSGYGHFWNIQEHYAGWSNFDKLIELVPRSGGVSDPGYRLKIVNSHEGEVVAR